MFSNCLRWEYLGFMMRVKSFFGDEIWFWLMETELMLSRVVFSWFVSLVLEEEGVCLAHLLLAGLAGVCVLVSATPIGCWLVEDCTTSTIFCSITEKSIKFVIAHPISAKSWTETAKTPKPLAADFLVIVVASFLGYAPPQII